MNTEVHRLCSSFRSKSLMQTLHTATLLADAMGISRVSEVTKLDVLDIPVFCSIRPGGKTLCVNAGKGLDPLTAEVGAFMEAIEYTAGENVYAAIYSDLSMGEFCQQLTEDVTVHDFFPKSVEALTLGSRVQCCEAEVIGTFAKKCYLPLEILYLCKKCSSDNRLFPGSTNGLASGNNVEEATFHGMLELMERDALSLSKVRNRATKIDRRTLPRLFRILADEWALQGIELIVHAVNNDFNLPCYQAYLMDDRTPTGITSTGSGLHFDSQTALTRAICEAAQSRLSHIHGGRDDVVVYFQNYDDSHTHSRRFSNHRERLMHLTMRNTEGFEYYKAKESFNCPQFTSFYDANMFLRNLIVSQTNAFVARYEFSVPTPELSVVKIVAPGLEHIEHNSKRVGKRALELL